MKSIVATLAVMAVAVIVLLYVLSRGSPRVETMELAGIDQSKPSSSYEQKTNHYPRPSYEMGPIQGSPSPFQVNQWLSYQV
jgi:hypothetical protein